MARTRYGDLGFISPKEAYYTGPDGTVDAARAEGMKRAHYLSQMDQFYAQFSAKKGIARRALGLEREKLDLGKQELDLNKFLGIMGIAEKRHTTTEHYDWEREKSDIGLSFLKSYFEGKDENLEGNTAEELDYA